MGDSAVYWADSFARSGYPSFRLDFPGFGDSYGDLPVSLLDFIESGGYASLVSGKAKELVERFNLTGIILVGLCAGAVSAVYAAAITGECKGMILMDPYFHTQLKSPPKIWQKLTGRISRTTLGLQIVDGCGRFKKYWGHLWNQLPKNANLLLLRRWKDVAMTGIPILLLRAPGGFKQRGDFDYLDHILKSAGRDSAVEVKAIQSTGHTFSNRKGRTAVRQGVESWLAEHFVLCSADRSTKEPSLSNSDNRADWFLEQELDLPK